MITEREYPNIIPPHILDDYLARGWYRMGQSIFTCHFLWFSDQLYSAIWLRLDLTTFSFNKRQRKLINRNEKVFRYEYGPLKLTTKKNRLYQRYRISFKGRIAITLRDSLQDGTDFNIYNTHEVRVYDGDKLIAFSFFDLGENSISSISGVYDPDYQSHSLGFYTMLLEMKYGLKKGYKYYYPGYIVPGYPRFDYKQKIGLIEYYNPINGEWKNYDKVNPPSTPLSTIHQRIDAIQAFFQTQEIAQQKCIYPLFEANLFGFWKAAYLEQPVFLWCYPEKINTNYLIVIYNLKSHNYQLLQCTQFDDLPFYINDINTKEEEHLNKFTELLIIEKVLAKSDDMTVIRDAAILFKEHLLE